MLTIPVGEGKKKKAKRLYAKDDEQKKVITLYNLLIFPLKNSDI